ncbi:hypothetical protein [Roseibium polysiphoniae]|uniref:hypothetical protein n=1 Tax=Roseibium polysiphoniae TaxID=2571221 RepID=UPI0025974C37|nr:hypothetical protein [uncultured Roseibium sp.]
MPRHILTVLAFILVTFAVQGLSHFVINVDHYASIGHLRAEPIMPLGFATMTIQGLILSVAMSRLWPDGTSIKNGMLVAGFFGLFLGSYMVLTESAKYTVPSIPTWMATEAVAVTTQFCIFGVVLGFIYRKRDTA